MTTLRKGSFAFKVNAFYANEGRWYCIYASTLVGFIIPYVKLKERRL